MLTTAKCLGVSACCLSLGATLLAERANPEQITVLKKGDIVYARGYFSPELDVVIKTIRGGNNHQINFLSGGLVPADAPMTAEACDKANMFHPNGDDATPWNLNGTYIGGNHGSSDVIDVTAKTHGLTVADIGGAWKDSAGVTFYLVKIVDNDHVLVLSENHGEGPVWSFVRKINGEKLIDAKNGRPLAVEAQKLTQLWPACRINNQEYLVDGKTPLKDDVPTPCDFLDIVEDYDIICPDSVLESIKKNPGKAADFVAKDLDAVLNNQIVYRYLPNGACVIRHHSTAKRDFNLGYMGFIQSAPLKSPAFNTREYYIPKTLPFALDDKHFDFRNIQDFSGPVAKALSFQGKNLENPANPPERFIQFLGEKQADGTKRKIGYALGYSLIEGVTRPEIRAKNAAQPHWIYTTSKSYPAAIDRKMGPIKAGTVFDCLAYRQYFDASACPDATCVYRHKQGDADILYADYHRSLDKTVIPLPKSLIGKKVEIVEKTPSVTVLSGDTVHAEGVALSVKDNYGYAVLKIK